jgi:hypothetical protein
MNLQTHYEAWVVDKMSIETALTQELQSVTGLSNKVFPIVAPEGIEAPYCVYELNDINRVMSLRQFDGLADADFSISVYHNTYKQAKELMDLVLTKIKSFLFYSIGGTYYCQNCKIENEIETYDYEPRKYQCQIDIQITFKED